MIVLLILLPENFVGMWIHFDSQVALAAVFFGRIAFLLWYMPASVLVVTG